MDREITGSDAQKLADFSGIKNDLDFVADLCTAVDAFEGSPSKKAPRRACFDSIVLRYRRCFKNGRRRNIPSDLLNTLSITDKELHDTLLHIADKSVAHCVDGTEENITYVEIGAAENGTTPIKIKVSSRSVLHHNHISMNNVRELVIKIKNIVDDECKNISEKILKKIEEDGIDEVNKLPEFKSGITEKKEVLRSAYMGKMDNK